MDPKTSARIEGLMPELLAKMRHDLKQFPLRRDFVLENGPGRYKMETTEFEYYYADLPELDGMVRILENYALLRDITRDHKKRFVIKEELAEYLLNDSMTPHRSAGMDTSPPRGRGFAANADDHQKVAAVIAGIGIRWTAQLKEVCIQLHRENVIFPETLRKAESVDSWEELADFIDMADSSSRELLRKYIKYRINWVRRHPPAA